MDILEGQMNTNPQLYRGLPHAREGWTLGPKGGTGSGFDPAAAAPSGLPSLLLLCSFSTVVNGHQLCSWACRCMRLSASVASYWKARAGARWPACCGWKGRRPHSRFGTNNKSTLRAETGGRWEQTGDAGAAGVHWVLWSLLCPRLRTPLAVCKGLYY